MPELDELIHQPVRLRIMACLVALDLDEQVDFAYLRDLLKLSDGNLGAHLGKLEAAQYVQIEKTFVSRKPRTFIRASGAGRDAFGRHVAALRQLLADPGHTES